jgi:NTP pyrophosphatase (non-canonical NTP hydrolase)
MDFHQYQLKAKETDQIPGQDEKSIMVPLLGLAGEAGSLLTEYKKHLRDGEAYRIFKERISEELGDILWYVANIATKADLNLENVAQENLKKIREHWRTSEEAETFQGQGERLFDEDFPSDEQFPRRFEIALDEITDGESVKVVLMMNGEKFGDHVTDNAYDDDGYRFHDVFHLAYAAILGWSPVTRALMKRKRKSKPRVDEVEDGGRAIAIEEAISAIVFDYAKGYSFFEGVNGTDYSLLSKIKSLTSHLEVKRCSTGDWECAILEGYRVWRQVRQHGRGIIVGDLGSRVIAYKPRQ